jgi:hypothetical protein
MFDRFLEKLGIYRYDHIKAAYIVGFKDGIRKAFKDLGADFQPMPDTDEKVVNLAQYKLERMK